MLCVDCSRSSRRPRLVLVAGAAAPAADVSPRRARQLYMGVSDGGSKTDYFHFAKAAGQHIPVMQAFETWNSWSQEAIKRWKRTETRGMLSLSTTGCYGCGGVISPRGIRKGEGDRYLLTVNRKLAEWGRPTYIRLLPEMNGHWNPYSAFNEDGSSRGKSHKTAQFRKAWKRSVIIIKGGRHEDDQPQAEAEQDAAAEDRPQGQRPAAEAPARAEGLVHVGPADGRLAEHQGQRPARLLAGRQVRRLDRRRHLRQVPELRRPQRLLQALPAQAVRDRRVGALGRRPAGLHPSSRSAGCASTSGRRWPSTTRASDPATRTRSGITRRARRRCGGSSSGRRWVSRAPGLAAPGGSGHSRTGPDGVPPPPIRAQSSCS